MLRSPSPATLRFIVAVALFATTSALAHAPTQAAASATLNKIPDYDVPAGSIGIAEALVFAFAGGLILNLMPCVFPVLSLKALAFASSGRARTKNIVHGLAYLLGVLASFFMLGLVLLTLRTMGMAVGWGIQFQSPLFVMILAGLFFGFALSLSGVFLMGTGLMGAGERLTRSTGPTGSFFTGALATLAATPCTAPYMGAAVGFALAAPAAVCILVLLTMGLGFALPMVGLSASPALVRLLPGPGPWLETVKRVLALPLYATAAWLVWVLSLQAGSNGVLAAVALMTGIGLSAWLMGRLTEAGRVARALPFGLVTLFGIAAISLLHATTPPSRVSEVTVSDTSRLSELSFAPGLIDELRSAGRPVFVNLTAAWCITCKVNETTALSSKGVRAALASYNIAYVKGDWTKPDPEISEFLRTFGRAGVPLYLLYPANLAAAPKVLPQLLTESLVLEELRAVAGREAQHQ